MAALILDGKAVAAKVRSEVAAGVKAFVNATGRPPGLAVVRVGHDPASQLYVRGKIKASAEVGMLSEEHHLPQETNTVEVVAAVKKLADREEIDGILVQLPLPKGVDQEIALSAVPAWKDVDGFDVVNLGRLVHGRRGIRACTPLGCMRLIAESGMDLRGKRAVVVGRSVIVGKPMALLLLEADATVTVCHSRTQDLEAEVKRADIVVAAIGKPEIIPGSWIKEGAVVIDVGQNRRADGKLVGDVEFSGASERASAITPVPGGVGPMTIAMLLENTLQAAKIRASGAP